MSLIPDIREGVSQRGGSVEDPPFCVSTTCCARGST